MSDLREIKVGRYITELPTNARIMKSYTGIGGTTAELTAKRNSIIIMPSLPAVKGKITTASDLYDHNSLHGVYGGNNRVSQITKYITDDTIEFKKLIITASTQSINSLLKAAEELPELFSYNLMLDEVDQIVEEGSWRTDLSLCYDLVSVWKSKSYELGYLQQGLGTVTVISATGIENIYNKAINKLPLYTVVSDEFERNYPINLIHTEDVEQTLAAVANDSNSERLFMFYNNVAGSERVLRALGDNSSKLYCSLDSEDRAGIYFENTLKNFGKYNCFTKSYFRAVDIREDGEVIVVMDINQKHLALSIEDVVQATGRLRNKVTKITIIMKSNIKEKEIKFNSAEEAYTFFYEKALIGVGYMQAMDLIGELSDTMVESMPQVRINIKGKMAVNATWVEKMVKLHMKDIPAYNTVESMQEALRKLGIDADIIENKAELIVVPKTDENWDVHIEYVETILNKPLAIFYTESFNSVQTLIKEGIELIGIDAVKKTTGKNSLTSRINAFKTIDQKNPIGLALNKTLNKGQWYSSKDLKIRLAELFKVFGYKETAKASLIDDFFTSNTVTRKRINGILSKGYIIGDSKYVIKERI